MEMKIKVDPYGKFTHATNMDIIKSCGYLTQWILEAEKFHTDEEPVTMKDRLLKNYVYYLGELDGGRLTPDGLYMFPGDEDLYPLVKFEFNGERCFIFKYAIVGIIFDNGETFVTRMD